MSVYRLYWIDGTTELCYGRHIADAFANAGYGHGAIKTLDFFTEGEDRKYEWDKESRSWRRV